MIALLAPHAGAHAAVHAAPVAAASLFFRRLVRPWWRKPAPPEVSTSASGAGRTGTSLLGEPVLGDRMLSEVRSEHNERLAGGLTPAQATAHAEAVNAMSARYLPAPPRHAHSLPRRRPMVDRPPWQTAEQPAYRNGWQ